MLEPHFTKSAGEKFKHEITAELRGISPIWTPSHCARDVGGMWMSPTLPSVQSQLLIFSGSHVIYYSYVMIAVRGGLPAQLMGHLFNHQPLRSSTTTSTISAATTISSQQLHHHFEPLPRRRDYKDDNNRGRVRHGQGRLKYTNEEGRGRGGLTRRLVHLFASPFCDSLPGLACGTAQVRGGVWGPRRLVAIIGSNVA